MQAPGRSWPAPTRRGLRQLRPVDPQAGQGLELGPGSYEYVAADVQVSTSYLRILLENGPELFWPLGFTRVWPEAEDLMGLDWSTDAAAERRFHDSLRNF